MNMSKEEIACANALWQEGFSVLRKRKKSNSGWCWCVAGSKYCCPVERDLSILLGLTPSCHTLLPSDVSRSTERPTVCHIESLQVSGSWIPITRDVKGTAHTPDHIAPSMISFSKCRAVAFGSWISP